MIQLFRVFIPASVIGLLLSEFLITFLCYVGASVLLYEVINPDFSPIVFFQNEGGLIRIGVVVACLVAGLYFQNLYANFRVKSLTLLVQQLCMSIGAAFLVQALFTYLKK